MRKIEYYVVSVSGNGGNHMADIGNSLHNIGFDDVVITHVDPSILPDDLLRTPNHEAFKGAFERIANDPDNPYYLVVHALQVGNGRVRRSTLIECGIPEETIDITLHVLGKHITNDPDDPDPDDPDPDKLYCNLLFKEPSEKVVFKA